MLDIKSMIDEDDDDDVEEDSDVYFWVDWARFSTTHLSTQYKEFQLSGGALVMMKRMEG